MAKLTKNIPPPPPEAENLHTEIISHDKFDIVTRLEQISNSTLFRATLGSNGGQKSRKLPTC